MEKDAFILHAMAESFRHKCRVFVSCSKCVTECFLTMIWRFILCYGGVLIIGSGLNRLESIRKQVFNYDPFGLIR